MTSAFPSRWSPPAGIGFRAPHGEPILAARPAVGFLEVHAENYMGGGAPLARLRDLAAIWPISLHGVGLSLGSAQGIDEAHLSRLARLVATFEPALVSEHLSWCVVDGVYHDDLLPLPYTSEALDVVTENVLRAQDRLRRALLLENPSAYLRFRHSPIPEGEFLGELVRRAGCGLLCDVNNIFVSTSNLGGDPYAWLDSLPADAVGEIHLAGHARNDADGRTILIDDHGSRVCDAVWELFDAAVARFPSACPLVEWDTDLPQLEVLVGEAAIADSRRRAVLLGATRTERSHVVAA